MVHKDGTSLLQAGTQHRKDGAADASKTGLPQVGARRCKADTIVVASQTQRYMAGAEMLQRLAEEAIVQGRRCCQYFLCYIFVIFFRQKFCWKCT